MHARRSHSVPPSLPGQAAPSIIPIPLPTPPDPITNLDNPKTTTVRCGVTFSATFPDRVTFSGTLPDSVPFKLTQYRSVLTFDSSNFYFS